MAFIDSFLDCVNDAPFWGYPRRCVKFSSRSWDRKFYGQCEVYYTLHLEFDIWVRQDGTSGFDRNLLDEGTKALNGTNVGGKWVITPVDALGTLPNYRNPMHYVRYKDKRGENAKCILDGFGKPISGDPTGAGRFFYRLSITAFHTPGDINDPAKWVTLREPPPLALEEVLWWEWEATVQYSLGDMVTDAGGFYVLITPGLFVVGDAPSTGAPAWHAIPQLTNKQAYNPLSSYADGDYVVADAPGTGTGVATQPGLIHVEKYPEVDFTLLGLPTDLFAIGI